MALLRACRASSLCRLSCHCACKVFASVSRWEDRGSVQVALGPSGTAYPGTARTNAFSMTAMPPADVQGLPSSVAGNLLCCGPRGASCGVVPPRCPASLAALVSVAHGAPLHLLPAHSPTGGVCTAWLRGTPGMPSAAKELLMQPCRPPASPAACTWHR